MKSRTIAVAVSKGGVGKTTTAVHLAHALAITGRRVLLVDGDAQGHVAFSLGLSPSRDLADIIEGNAVAADVILEARPGLFVIPAGDRLAALDLTDPLRFAGVLESIPGRYDYTIIDAAPGWDALGVNVLAATRELLVPIVPELLAVRGLGAFLERVDRVKQINRKLALRYVVPTMVDLRPRQTGEVLEQLQSIFPSEICEPVRRSIRVSEATGRGETVFEYAPRSTAADDYRTLAERVDNDT
jgi:chromosome partitioning protein